MRDNKIKQRINCILARCLSCDEACISEDMHLIIDLYADSLTFLEVLLEIGESFNFAFTDDQIVAVETVGDIYRLVDKHIAISKVGIHDLLT